MFWCFFNNSSYCASPPKTQFEITIVDEAQRVNMYLQIYCLPKSGIQFINKLPTEGSRTDCSLVLQNFIIRWILYNSKPCGFPSSWTQYLLWRWQNFNQIYIYYLFMLLFPYTKLSFISSRWCTSQNFFIYCYYYWREFFHLWQ